MNATETGTDDLAQRCEEFYERELKAKLEPDHRGEIVVIEPDTGGYILGKTLEETVPRAMTAWPGKGTYAKRIGYRVVYTYAGGGME